MLPLFIIYDNPKDYEGWFVVREWRLNLAIMAYEAGSMVGMAISLENARAMVPPGCCNIGRYAEDDPVIAEVWV